MTEGRMSQFRAAVQVANRTLEVCRRSDIRFGSGLFYWHDGEDKRMQNPDPSCLPTEEGIFIEMVLGSPLHPRAILTPWGAWFCYRGSFILDTRHVAVLKLMGIVLEKASNEPLHNEQNQLIYEVREVDRLAMPRARLMPFDQVTYGSGMEDRLEEWCTLMRQYIPSYRPDLVFETKK
ncbi:MAG: hypothetical protein A2660_02425 [Candidatus Doudnabacteria bacterium RIFCSPHIGHO2_01_FULL_45_18]|uniref:Uncharacterized protein n=1 Tax=Candidatus Doudnabacteria bacterium RIFCSPHIGHO2_01_FULL_45_18 TaxID=1817823 RepID=A0A1F5NRK0_9BACT|nr:MAG: hypothetical protein A2660_02425 [Candidatus Doudnabacteria bacterium RIFCSPHIGHO2_01_FULL_45_18]